MSTPSRFIAIAAANGGWAVLMGAFGAHGLRGALPPALMQAYETGAAYHLTHAVVLLTVGLLLWRRPESTWLKASAWCFAVGMLLFSGSLYVMAITGLSALGIVTPIGGLVLITGWGLLCIGALQAGRDAA